MKRSMFAVTGVALLMCALVPVWAGATPKVDCWIEAPTTAAINNGVDPDIWDPITVYYRNKGDANACNLVIYFYTLPAGVTLNSGDTSWTQGTPLAPSTSVTTANDTFNVANTVADGTNLDWQVTCEYTDCATANLTDTDTAQTLAIERPERVLIGDHTGPANFSPDGSQVVFAGWTAAAPCCNANDKEIILYDVASANQTALTSNDMCDSHPSFSPDGKRIVFQRHNQDSRGTIWVMNADGTDQHVILDWGEGGDGIGSGCYQSPEWTVDGRIIVKLDVDEKIYVANADGTDLHAVADAGTFQNYYDTRMIDNFPQALLRGENDYYYIKQLLLYNLYRNQSGVILKTLGAFGEAQMGRFRPWRTNQVLFKDDWANYGNLFLINTDGRDLRPLTAKTRVLEYQLSDDENTVTLDYPNIISIEGVWLANDPDAGTKKGVNYFPNGELALSNDESIELPVPLGNAGAQTGVLVTYTYLPEDCSSRASWDASGQVIVSKSEWDDNEEHIFLMQADGSNKIRLTFDDADGSGSFKKMPQISATGETVLFSVGSNGRGSVNDLTLIKLPASTNARSWVGLNPRWARPSGGGGGGGGGCGMMNFSTSALSLLLMLSPLAGLGLSRMRRRGRR